MEQSLQRLEKLYMFDPDDIIIKTKYTAMRRYNGGQESEDPQLAELRRDYAAFWLIKRLLGTELPDMKEQSDHWQGALAAVPDRHLALTLAVAGFDPITPRLNDNSPVLHGFVFCATAGQIDEFMQYIPPVHRAAQINQRSDDDMTVMHVAALGAGAGSLALLQEYGGNPAMLMNITLPDKKVVKGNCAHIAAVGGRCEMVAELMALDRGLFALTSAETAYRPDQLVEYCFQHAGGANIEMRKAANLAAHAVDLPVPYPEAGWILQRLQPATAPRACLPKNSFN